MLSWTALGSLLSSYTSRAAYTLPLAGYVILYSDYFQKLFQFSSLTASGFLTTTLRADFIYYGSLLLLVAFVIWWLSAPRLLKGKRDLQHFVSDIVVARDRSTVIEIANSPPFTAPDHQAFVGSLTAGDKKIFEQVARELKSRGADIGDGAGEYEHRIPTALGFYFRWQNQTRWFLRWSVGLVALAGFLLLVLPAIDLLLRVLSTHYRSLFG